MTLLISGEDIAVLRPYTVDIDAFNAPVVSWSREDVANVLVAPTASNDVGITDFDETRRGYTLHFPKSYGASLRGCRVVVRGEEFRVVGDPRPYMVENTPGDWWMPVNVEAVDG